MSFAFSDIFLPLLCPQNRDSSYFRSMASILALCLHIPNITETLHCLE